MNTASLLFRRFMAYVKPYRKTQILVFISSSMGILLSLVSPYLSKPVIDKAFIHKDPKIFILLTIIGAAIFILSSLFTLGANFFAAKCLF